MAGAIARDGFHAAHPQSASTSRRSASSRPLPVGSRSRTARASSVLASTISARALPSTAWRNSGPGSSVPAPCRIERLQHSVVVGDRLSVRERGEGAIAGGHAVAQAGVPVPGGHRVVRQFSGICRLGLELRQRPGMPRRASRWCQLGADQLGDDVVAYSPRAARLDEQTGRGEPAGSVSRRDIRESGEPGKVDERRQSIADGGGAEQVGCVGTGGGGAAQHERGEVGIAAAPQPLAEQQRVARQFAPSPRTSSHPRPRRRRRAARGSPSRRGRASRPARAGRRRRRRGDSSASRAAASTVTPAGRCREHQAQDGQTRFVGPLQVVDHEGHGFVAQHGGPAGRQSGGRALRDRAGDRCRGPARRRGGREQGR